MDLVKICGAVVICALTAVLLKQLGTPLHVAAVIAGAVAAVIFVIPKISEIVTLALEAGSGADGVSYIPTVLKVAGAALICDASCGIADAAGEQTLSKALGAAGKIEIVYLSLPVLRDLIDSAKTIAQIEP